jgi:anti-anti-sigma factor
MSNSAFSAHVRHLDGVPVIDLNGEVNAAAEAELDVAFAEATRSHPGTVLLNFEQVTYINSTGIALIVGLLADARKTRLQLLVCGLTEHYRHIFNITRLADFMSIHDDEASAIATAAAVAEATE